MSNCSHQYPGPRTPLHPAVPAIQWLDQPGSLLRRNPTGSPLPGIFHPWQKTLVENPQGRGGDPGAASAWAAVSGGLGGEKTEPSGPPRERRVKESFLSGAVAFLALLAAPVNRRYHG